MRIVVVGGAGFIGSAVCRTLVGQHGATVLNIDKLTASSSLASLQPIAASPRYSFRRADICDRERLTALLHAFNPDAVVHAATERRLSGQIGGASDAFQTNALGTWRLLDATRDFWDKLKPERQESFRFVSVSAQADPDNPATAIRAGADELVTAWHKSYGLPTIVSKASPTFGPYQFPSEQIPSAIIRAIDGAEAETAKTCGEGEWLFLGDHVDAIIAMIRKGTQGAIYPVGGDSVVAGDAVEGRIRALVERLSARGARTNAFAAGKSLVSEPLDQSARLERDTGWKPMEKFDNALETTVAWYLAHQAWWRPLQAAEAAGQDGCLLRIA